MRKAETSGAIPAQPLPSEELGSRSWRGAVTLRGQPRLSTGQSRMSSGKRDRLHRGITPAAEGWEPQGTEIVSSKALLSSQAQGSWAVKRQLYFLVTEPSGPSDSLAPRCEKAVLGWFILTLRQRCDLAFCLGFPVSRVGQPPCNLLHLLGCHED